MVSPWIGRWLPASIEETLQGERPDHRRVFLSLVDLEFCVQSS